jgi:hypothetical protein
LQRPFNSLEDLPKLRFNNFPYLVYFDRAAQAILKGRHGALRHPTGVDQAEVSQISTHVQSKTVHGDPLPHPDSNRRKLTLFCPHPSQALPLKSFDSEEFGCLDQALFKSSEVAEEIPPSSPQIQVGIAYQLARSMVGDITSPINTDYLERLTVKILVGQEVIGRSPTPDCENPRMFNEIYGFFTEPSRNLSDRK